MDQRLLFSSIALESIVAYWPFSLLALSVFVDSSVIGELYLFFAEASLVPTAVSVIVIALGVLRKGTIAPVNSQVIVVLSAIAVLGTLVSALWTIGAASWASLDCGPLTQWKCDLVQAGTYVGYYFFPAIAVPLVTLVWGLGNLAGTRVSY